MRSASGARSAASPAARGRPPSSSACWRAISARTAPSTARNEFRFLSSVRVPRGRPAGAERDVGVAAEVTLLEVCRPRRRRSAGSRGARAGRRPPPPPSGGPARETISISGTPARFRSTRVPRARAVVDRLAGVLLHVDARDADAPRPASAAGLDLEPAARREGLLVLRDLVALREVGVEVVLAREDRARVHLAVGGEGHAQRQLDGAAVEHRQRAGQREADRAGVEVRRVAVAHGAGAEQLARASRGARAPRGRSPPRRPSRRSSGAAQVMVGAALEGGGEASGVASSPSAADELQPDGQAAGEAAGQRHAPARPPG